MILDLLSCYIMIMGSAHVPETEIFFLSLLLVYMLFLKGSICCVTYFYKHPFVFAVKFLLF